MKDINKKALTLKTLNKSNIWDLQENDIFRMLNAAEKDADIKENINHYIDIIKSAFDLEEISVDRPEVIKKYESRGFKVGTVRVDEGQKVKTALKKHSIMRVTDLTYENIRHISAAKLMEIIDRNFGGGWESLSQSIQDIILSGFDISTTTLPKDRLHKPGGMYEKKVADGFDVLEITKGTWVEAIFAKLKPAAAKPVLKLSGEAADDAAEDDDSDDDISELDDKYIDAEDEDELDEEQLTEESYRTTIDENPEDLDLTVEDIADEEEDY